MEFSQGVLGRFFLAKFDNEDDVLKGFCALAKKRKIKSAVIILLGAIRKGHLVTGPKKPVVPPEPNWLSFDQGWEVMGVGSIFSNASGPQVHLHCSMGKKRRMLTGCLRKESRVFLVLEAFVFEIKGIDANKDPDPKTGLNLLRLATGIRI